MCSISCGCCWSSLFSSKLKHQFVSLTMKYGKKSMVMSMSILDQGISLWKDCLIGQFFGSPPKLTFIQSMVEKLWGRARKVDVIPLDGDGFMFKFSDSKTFSWVLEGPLVHC